MTPKFNLKLIPLLSKLTIQAKDLSVSRIPFNGEFAWAQVPYIRTIEREYNQGKPVRIIILKARQLGMSTITQGVLYNWCFIHPGTNSLVIAHESNTSQSIYEKTQLFWETWPWRSLYSTRHLSQRRISWNETKSSIQIATARNLNTGVGRTIHALHASECALWENAKTLMSGLSQTIPEKHGTLIVLESTARGVGNWFHSEWEAAITRQSDYIPLFFPWYKHPEYQVQAHRLTLKATDLTTEEKDYYKIGCDLRHLEWRRWMIPNKLQNDPDKFKQEYPATPEEAFLMSGTNIFPLDRLTDVFKERRGTKGFLQRLGNKVRFVPDSSGPVIIYAWPSNNREFGQYFVGGDPTYTTTGDNACIQVINRRTYEQVAVWHGKCDSINLAEEILKMGIYYNEAMVTCEIEGPGQATIAALIKSGYNKIWQHRWADRSYGKLSTTLGWSTNHNRKHWAIDQLKWMVGDKSITIHDRFTYIQMRNYVVRPNGELGNNNEIENDDAVMALAITVICSITEGPVSRQHPLSPPQPDMDARIYLPPSRPSWADRGEYSPLSVESGAMPDTVPVLP